MLNNYFDNYATFEDLRNLTNDTALQLVKANLENQTCKSNPREDYYAVMDYPICFEITQKIIELIKKASQVVIYGDYDADGVLGALILFKTVKELNPTIEPVTIFPERTDGYGLTARKKQEVLDAAAGKSLIIIVDNGINSADAIADMKAAGNAVIVIDHHKLNKGTERPNCDVVVDCEVSGLQPICSESGFSAATTAFLLLKDSEISSALKDELLVYAGISTITDCMQVSGLNKKIISGAIFLCHQGKIPFRIKQLISNSEPQNITEKTFGFSIGPKINAAGRMSSDGANLIFAFLTSAPRAKGSGELKTKIERLNKERKALVATLQQQAFDYIETNRLDSNWPITVYLPESTSGVNGLVASAIVKRYNRPAIVFCPASNDPDIYTASARTFGNYSIYSFIDAHKDLLIAYGGHTGAAGLSLQAINFKKFANIVDVAGLIEHASDKIETTVYQIDSKIVHLMYDVVNTYAPYGQGNPAPLFCVYEDYGYTNNLNYCHEIVNEQAGYMIRDFEKGLLTENLENVLVCGQLEPSIDKNRPNVTVCLTCDKVLDPKEYWNGLEYEMAA